MGYVMSHILSALTVRHGRTHIIITLSIQTLHRRTKSHIIITLPIHRRTKNRGIRTEICQMDAGGVSEALLSFLTASMTFAEVSRLTEAILSCGYVLENEQDSQRSSRSDRNSSSMFPVDLCLLLCVRVFSGQRSLS